jgi:rhodanese-related sulfurtransferase
MRSLQPSELKALLDTPACAPVILDVREPWEYEICHIDGGRLIPMAELSGRLEELDPTATTVVICHHGMRSQAIARFLEQAGFVDVANLDGGIDAWAREIDPKMAQY